MRRIRSILGLVAVATLAGTSAALAVTACDRPPPAWYTAPRLTHTYSQSWGAGYSSHASTHEYSAQRRSYSVQPRYTSQRSYTRTTSSDRFRRPFWQW
ncbi:MAG TPA: hypothetical protein VHD59_16410 [Pseudolabrys sp.]|nr:hypothetical protein [Pseudolabrys sp.]